MNRYCGHNSGEKYLDGYAVQKLDNTPTAVILMGCSSAKIRKEGDFDGTGMPINYLLSGS